MSEEQNRQKQVRLPFFGIPALWPFVKPYRRTVFWMVSIGVVVSLADAVYPLFNQYAINHFVAGKTLDTLPFFVGGYLLIVIVQSILNYRNIVDCASVEMYLDRDLRNSAFSHLQEVSLSYYNQNNVGYIHARVMSDTGKIGEMFAWRIMDIVWFGSYIIMVLGIMLLTNWRLALCVIALMPVAVLLIAFFQKKLLVHNRRVREINSQITADINEGITGAKSIKTLVIEDKMWGEFRQDTATMYRRAVRTAHFSALFSASITLMSAVALSIVLWKGGEMTTQQIMQVGTLSVFMQYALGLLDPIQNIIDAVSRMIAIQVNVERYLRLVHTEGEVYDTPEVIKKYGDSFRPKRENWERLHGDVEFEDVTFHYPDGEELVLEHFNLKVPQGSSVAIVGETGAGKSTLVNLVCRFFEPTEGRVLIDGRDAKERSLKWLHSNLGYVLQTPYLFSGTVRDNLRYGKPGATDEEIKRALHMVSADFVVEKLKDGLDTEIGESGDSLSTGEKQLLSIARALLADPRILILDEATSSIDTETEKTIQNAVTTLIRDRTSFVIAHRLSTIVHSDVILVVSQGKIIERGTHQELMEQRGEYFQLYTRQYEELLAAKMGEGVQEK